MPCGAALLAAALVATPVALVSAGPAAGQPPLSGVAVGAACDGTWTAVPSPNPGSAGNVLAGVVAVAPDLAWAVGHSSEPYREGQATGGMSAAVQRWDGERWTVDALPPSDGVFGARLSDVAAVSRSDAWAVGAEQVLTEDGFPLDLPLLLHWDGSAWSRIAAPGAGPLGNGALTAVVAVGPDDVWAVGVHLPDLSAVEATQPLLMHWDGQRWSTVAGDRALDRFPSARLEGVSAASGNDVWAVGSGTTDGVVREPLVQRWDGVRWTAVPAPAPALAAQKSFGTVLHDVVARGPRDVVAVGATGTAPFVIRWDGRRWGRIRIAVDEVAGLTGVSATEHGTVLGVGTLVDADTLDGQAFGIELAGRSTVVPAQQVEGSFDTRLADVSAVAGRQWAVGSAVLPGEGGGPSVQQTLVQTRCTS